MPRDQLHPEKLDSLCEGRNKHPTALLSVTFTYQNIHSIKQFHHSYGCLFNFRWLRYDCNDDM